MEKKLGIFLASVDGGFVEAVDLRDYRALQAELARLKSAAADYDAADDDAEWNPPHPIFKMAAEIDGLQAELAAMREQKPENYQRITPLYAAPVSAPSQIDAQKCSDERPCINCFSGQGECLANTPSQVAAEVVQWIPVSERLPEPDQVVALLNDGLWMNTGADGFECNWHGAGYLSTDSHRPYWNVFGETRAQCLDAATHWAPMPALLATRQGEA